MKWAKKRPKNTRFPVFLTYFTGTPQNPIFDLFLSYFTFLGNLGAVARHVIGLVKDLGSLISMPLALREFGLKSIRGRGRNGAAVSEAKRYSLKHSVDILDIFYFFLLGGGEGGVRGAGRVGGGIS